MEKVYKNRKNFLGSQVGLITKTITVPANFASYVVENGRKIVVKGTVFTSPYYGLLYEDVDITDGARLGSLMIAGQYIDANLPASASAYVSNFAAQGLFPIVEGSTTRPDFGTNGLTALSTPVATSSGATISWASISGATGYTIYNASKVGISTVSTTSYTATASGAYYVGANGDYVYNKNSALSSSVSVTVG